MTLSLNMTSIPDFLLWSLKFFFSSQSLTLSNVPSLAHNIIRHYQFSFLDVKKNRPTNYMLLDTFVARLDFFYIDIFIIINIFLIL